MPYSAHMWIDRQGNRLCPELGYYSRPTGLDIKEFPAYTRSLQNAQAHRRAVAALHAGLQCLTLRLFWSPARYRRGALLCKAQPLSPRGVLPEPGSSEDVGDLIALLLGRKGYE